MSRRILIVDDHAGFRASARRMLEAGGFEVVGEADDGATARSGGAGLSPELVLLDVQLPDSSGIDLAGELSANGGPPVISLLEPCRRSVRRGPQRAARSGFVPKDELSAEAITELVP